MIPHSFIYAFIHLSMIRLLKKTCRTHFFECISILAGGCTAAKQIAAGPSDKQHADCWPVIPLLFHATENSSDKDRPAHTQSLLACGTD